MTDTRDNALVYAAGNVMAYYSPFGTADPGIVSNALPDPPSPWICLGWIDTTGTTFKIAEALKEINAAGTLDPIRTLVTGAPKTWDATFVEGLNPAIRALYDDVDISDLEPDPTSHIASYVMPEIPTNNHYAFIFDSFDEDRQMRSFCPEGKVTTRGNDQAQQADATMLALTFSVYPQLIGGVRSAMKRYIDYGSTDVSVFFS